MIYLPLPGNEEKLEKNIYVKANLVREEVLRSKADSLMYVAEKTQEKLKRNGWYQGHTMKILMG